MSTCLLQAKVLQSRPSDPEPRSCIILAMSSELVPLPEAEAPTLDQQYAVAVGSALADNMSLSKLAGRMAKGNRRKERALRRKFRQMAARDPLTREILQMAAGGELMAGLPGAAQALARRASRGYIPAIKLLFEATGFHNPRMQHEHSGEVVIRLEGIQRAPVVEDEVTDAEVVEE